MLLSITLAISTSAQTTFSLFCSNLSQFSSCYNKALVTDVVVKQIDMISLISSFWILITVRYSGYIFSILYHSNLISTRTDFLLLEHWRLVRSISYVITEVESRFFRIRKQWSRQANYWDSFWRRYLSYLIDKQGRCSSHRYASNL